MSNNKAVSVTLRIEGKTTTVFEGPVCTTFHRIEASDARDPDSGKLYLYHCNGLNYDHNPSPGSTCTTALDDGSTASSGNFPYAATYYPDYDDLLITSINGETPLDGYSWAIARNFAHLNVGGCQEIVQTGDEALFAYAHSYTEEHPTPTYLKLSGPTSACANTDVTLTVTDAAGTPIESVNIYKLGDGQRELLGQTNANGQFTTAFAAATYELKADKDDAELFSIRSNKLTLVVT